MGLCPSRYQALPPSPPTVVVNVQAVPGGEPPPPVPEAAAPAVPEPEVPPPPPVPKKIRKTSAREHRQLALQALFKNPVQKCPTGEKIHIQGFCNNARVPTAQMPPMPFCKTCVKAYLKADAASLPENTPEDEED